MVDRYVCHSCGRSFELGPTSPTISCTHCNSEFVERLELPASSETATSPSSFTIIPGGFLFTSSTNSQIPFPELVRFLLNPGTFPSDHPLFQLIGFRGDPRDYVVGEGAFQALLGRLFEEGGRVVGMSEEQVEELPREIIEEIGGTCAICQEPYKKGEETIKVPCGHRFHADCVTPWFKRVASCPVCRHDPMQPTS